MADGRPLLHGYVTDVAYLRHFCPELSPTLIRAVCALNGVTPPPADGFTYVELGCGHGDSTATLAAAYPRSRFWGVDLLPEHIATARALAEGGELSNVTFLEKDFANLAGAGIPPLDYLAAFGVLSWVPAASRAALIAYAGHALKLGGMLFVSYNAQPGWAALEPLRRLLRASAPPEGEADTRSRAEQALAAVQVYAAADAGYFVHNPTAREMLATMVRAGLPYIAHEYFHDWWHCLDFGDLGAELLEAGFHHVGQLPLHRNVVELALPPAVAELAQRQVARDPFAIERAKDYVANTFFRNDVFVKGRPVRHDETPLAYLETTRFGTLAPAANLATDRPAGLSSLRIDGPLFPPLLARLAEEDATLADLAGEPALAVFSRAEVRAALVQLLLTDAAAPFLAEEPPENHELAGATGVPTIPLAYNRASLAAALHLGRPAVLASPRAGTGVQLSLDGAVALSAHVAVGGGRPGELDAWLASFVARRRARLWDHDRAIEDPAEQVRFLATRIARFVETELPKLVALEIVRPARSSS